MRQDPMLDLGLRLGDGLMRLRQFLNVIDPGFERVKVALRRANPQHMKDHRASRGGFAHIFNIFR